MIKEYKIKDENKMETKGLTEDEKYIVNLAGLLKVISHPARLCIVKKLYFEGSCNVSYFTGCMDVSQSGVSQHLGKLKDLGIVEVRRQGTESYYSLVNRDVKKIIETFFVEEENE